MLLRVLLMEKDYGIAVSVHYAHDEVSYNCHTGAIASKLLVSHLRIVLLSLYVLMVIVQDV